MSLHLFDIVYDEGDEPYTYASETLEAAIAAYRRDAGSDAAVIRSRQVPDDEVMRILDDGETREVRAADLAAESMENQCVLCDPHYC